MVEITLIIGVVVAMTQLAKPVISAKYLPALSLLLGIVTGIFYVDGDMKMRIFNGIVIGLSAAGLFDQSKFFTKKGDGK